MKLTILILFLLTSCGKIKIDSTPIEVKTDIPESLGFGPDFEKAADFCDERYGVNTQGAEDCFKDYRTFLSPKVTFDFMSIKNFCKGNYTIPEEIAACESDLIGIIKNVNLGE